ncbi:hypothetical protein FrEUN1fDRAFT_6918 [Parafrankia sp. EUN1f]|nr:hypothetical protein FrEUN1fDRAFT_6918 [Parafrankia sp. EUN1f]
MVPANDEMNQMRGRCRRRRFRGIGRTGSGNSRGPGLGDLQVAQPGAAECLPDADQPAWIGTPSPCGMSSRPARTRKRTVSRASPIITALQTNEVV